MDIKEIAEQVSKRIYVEDGLLLSKFISEKFAEALIESYKAELLKEVGEPVAEVIWFDPALELFPSKQPHKIIDGSMSFMDSSKIGTKFYTSDQVAAAIIKATKPLIEERDRAVKRMKAGWIEVCDSGILAFKEMNDELRAQLAAAQEELQAANSECDLFRNNGRISDANEIAELRDQLAKAEQRVAEACALQVATEIKFHWLDAARVAKEIRSGEQLKFVKEEV